MAANVFTSLAMIKPFKTSWRVQVKIVHTWKQYTAYTGETIEMILADVEVSSLCYLICVLIIVLYD